MELLHAREIAIELMEKYGLIDKGWKFRWDNAKRRFGICIYSKFDSGRGGIIGLSQYLVDLNNEENVVDTILHEIAHALVGRGHGHDAIWKAKAIEIGCDGQRCYSGEDVNTPKPKYKGVCCNGHESFRHRKPNQKLSCGKCSRKFDEKYLLVWEPVK